jgi:hypothetical protein
MIGKLSVENCTDMCACTSSACYKPTTDDGLVGLYPYCSGGTCNTYAVVYLGTLTNVDDAGDVQDADTQIDTDTWGFKPVSNSVYKKLTKVGCNGCPVEA